MDSNAQKVEAKQKRKISLSSVTASGSDTQIEEYYKKLVNDLKKTQNEAEKINILSKSHEADKKLLQKIKAELHRLKKEKAKVYAKLKKNKNREQNKE